MQYDAIIEQALERSLEGGRSGPQAPPILAEALRYSVFPGGARVRPQLCFAVAHAHGAEPRPGPVAGAGVAIELMHCASLVHDDLPCFDNAELRRGKPSVHKTFGEEIAVLAGDGLILLAMAALMRECADDPVVAMKLHEIVIDAVAPPTGIIAGQAWESEPQIDLRAYHRSKTGALFVAAVKAGAVCAGDEPAAWAAVGERLGEAYQTADDLLDVMRQERASGKPGGQDLANGRPNAARTLGVQGAMDHLNALIDDAAEAIPPCEGADKLRQLVRAQAMRLAPERLVGNAS
ncbi:MAG: polyprenyl synthetase family protein [Pseudomonadota bacterium]